jgi:transcriptional regulator with XRE-family HTH domain
MKLGDRIRYLRINLGLTQEELGRKVGLTKSAINKYEKGSVENMKQSMIARFASALDVSPVYLLGLEDPKQDDEDRLISLFRRMSDEGRAYLLKTAEMASRTYLKKDTDIPCEVG